MSKYPVIDELEPQEQTLELPPTFNFAGPEPEDYSLRRARMRHWLRVRGVVRPYAGLRGRCFACGYPVSLASAFWLSRPYCCRECARVQNL